MNKISLYSAPISNVIPSKEITLKDLEIIIKNNYSNQTNKVRITTNIKEKDTIKLTKFDYVTFSGTFKKRNNISLINYSGYIGIDIDKIGNLVEESKKILTFEQLKPIMLFTSVSGKGLRVIYKFDTTFEEHLACFSKLKDIFDYYLSIKIDESGKDIARASFICYDPDIYYNKDLDNEKGYSSNDLDLLLKSAFKIKAKKYLESYVINKITNSQDDYKAQTLFKIALHVGDFVGKTIVEEKYFRELMISEIFKKNLKSEYRAIKIIEDGLIKGKKSSYLKKETILKLIDGDKISTDYLESKLDEEAVLTSKEFWLKIEDKLPKKILDFFSQYETIKEKEILFLSILTGLSSSLSYIDFNYRNEILYPMLNLFVVGNAGSHKGLLKFGRNILINLDEVFKKNNDKSIGFNAGGNFSYSALLRTLSYNNGHGIIFDSEADIISSNSNFDWGNFSSLIRKTFHHEEEIVTRKGESSIKLTKPKLSVLISGTNDQLINMFPSSENGHFSRFMFYVSNAEKFIWSDVSLNDNYNNRLIEELNEKIASYYEKYRKESISITISQKIYNSLNQNFQEWCKTLESKYINFESSIIVRMAIMCLRLAITYQTLTKMLNDEELNKNEELTNECFEIASFIIDELIRYSIQLSMNLKEKPRNTPILDYSELDFIQKIKDLYIGKEFKREEVKNIAKEYNISIRKFDTILSDNRWFYRIRSGYYFCK